MTQPIPLIAPRLAGLLTAALLVGCATVPLEPDSVRLATAPTSPSIVILKSGNNGFLMGPPRASWRQSMPKCLSSHSQSPQAAKWSQAFNLPTLSSYLHLVPQPPSLRADTSKIFQSSSQW